MQMHRDPPEGTDYLANPVNVSTLQRTGDTTHAKQTLLQGYTVQARQTSTKALFSRLKGQLQLGICERRHLLAVPLLFLGIFHILQLGDGLRCWYGWAFSNSLMELIYQEK